MRATSPPALWFGALGGPTAYAAHLVVSFWMVPAACTGAQLWMLVLATVLAGAVAAFAAATALRAYRRLPAPAQPAAPRRGRRRRAEPAGAVATSPRARFLALAGAALSTLSTAIILLAGSAIPFLEPCAP